MNILILIFLTSLCAVSRPNIVYVMADDMGWADISVHGSDIPTPNIDRFFRESTELTQFMAYPVCSPTRAGFLTGRHPLIINNGPAVDGHLLAEHLTIAEAFQQAGYQTGAFGKWHNGEAVFRDEEGNPLPTPAGFVRHPGKQTVNEHGFHEWVGFYAGGNDYLTKEALGVPQWFHNDLYVPSVWDHDARYANDKTGYVTDLLADYAIEFIEKNAQTSTPFFCYVPFSAPHTPIMYKDPENPDPRIPAHRVDNPDQDKVQGRAYAEMMIYLDDAFGRIMERIEALGLREDTIVVFTSDNGGSKHHGADNTPLLGGKHTLFEGGIRVATAIRWPQGGLVGVDGSSKYDGLMGYLDMYPTLSKLCGVEMPYDPDQPIDGYDVSEDLLNGTIPSRVPYYTHYFRGVDTVRAQQYKFTRTGREAKLFDLKNGLETVNISEQHPEKLAELKAIADAYVAENELTINHLPLLSRPVPPASPQGEVLKVTVHKTAAVLADPYYFKITGRVKAAAVGEQFEYELYLPEHSRDLAFNVTLVTHLTRKGADALLYEHSYDNEWNSYRDFPGDASEGYRKAVENWQKYRVGLSSRAPISHGWPAVKIHPNAPVGTYTFYLDNLVVRGHSRTSKSVEASYFEGWTGNHNTSFTIPEVEGLTVTAEVVENPYPILYDSAEFIRSEFSDSPVPGEQFEAKVTFKNNSLRPWRAEEGYRVAATGGAPGGHWKVSEQPVASGVTVLPGESHTFTLRGTAPEIAGLYPFDWQMKNRDGFFGEKSFDLNIVNQSPELQTLLESGETILSGETIEAAAFNKRLTLQYDGNLVLSEAQSAEGGGVIWASDSQQAQIGDYHAQLHHDGNLVIKAGLPASPGPILYETSGGGTLGDYALVIEGDQLSVVKESSAGYYEQYWSNIRDYLVVGEKLRTGEILRDVSQGKFLTLQRDGNLVVYKGTSLLDREEALWDSGSDEGLSSCFLNLQRDGNVVIYEGHIGQVGRPIWEVRGSTTGTSHYYLSLGAVSGQPELQLGYPPRRTVR